MEITEVYIVNPF